MNAIRVSDAERESVVVRLTAATAEGRLTLAEFGDRSIMAYAAKTHGELDALTVDLPNRVHGYRSRILSVLAVAGGVVWMPLFPYLDFGALVGTAGVLFGVAGIRTNAAGLFRALAILGLFGGSVGIVLQITWLIFRSVT